MLVIWVRLCDRQRCIFCKGKRKLFSCVFMFLLYSGWGKKLGAMFTPCLFFFFFGKTKKKRNEIPF